jgi:hypothetical protein
VVEVVGCFHVRRLIGLISFFAKFAFFSLLWLCFSLCFLVFQLKSLQDHTAAASTAGGLPVSGAQQVLQLGVGRVGKDAAGHHRTGECLDEATVDGGIYSRI